MGLYTSNVEQMYGKDEDTGRNWGLVTTDTSTSVNDEMNKYSSFKYYNGALNFNIKLATLIKLGIFIKVYAFHSSSKASFDLVLSLYR